MKRFPLLLLKEGGFFKPARSAVVPATGGVGEAIREEKMGEAAREKGERDQFKSASRSGHGEVDKKISSGYKIKPPEF